MSGRERLILFLISTAVVLASCALALNEQRYLSHIVMGAFMVVLIAWGLARKKKAT